ncbi:hypothetical protein ACFV6G_34095, partial [Streptomyces lavendulae]|uniref:hypothetical protein n=1 Tax=Streptomyces lavendulae TaxID=1914 RepID=UPI0036B684B6
SGGAAGARKFFAAESCPARADSGLRGEGREPFPARTEEYPVDTIHFTGGPLAGLTLTAPAPWPGGWCRFESSRTWTLYVPAYRDGREVLAEPRAQTRA